ncbi:hypothetical protein [Methylobacterium sp. SI9]|uniref:hypothetical protein n=1 Tax=Methylobacterium guangdongense TaxID=3138811 RepID=UPI00313AA1DD
MSHLSFWIAAIVVPLLSVGANCVLRICLKRPQSAAADVILTMIVFDAVVISQIEEFKKFVTPLFKEDIASVFVFLLLLDFCFWIISVIVIEDRMDRLFNRRTKTYKPGIAGPILGAVVVSVIVIGLNVVPFAYGR